ncbi:hypothetical protein [Flavobacterium luteum]|uniref:Uncharacterized protein n=1 Tax=Flavobacterium luteum TaxID=2026654 RepID=A0A7J5AKI1_9FLAO|nr:hypothetical protein [Flavobacterium luteum]KAB1157938.1 hypothetical protein F6464_02320 [Flavobacterium luteum]
MTKKNKKLVFHLNMLGHGPSNPILLRINLFPEFTKVDFGYSTTELYDNGGWIKIAPDTFIENVAYKERYTMTKAVGITVAPELRNFESKKDWQYFSLYFPPIPQKDCVLSIVEVENGTPNDFNYYNVDMKMGEGVEIL